ncbi:MAG: hypothetical protein AABZ64_06735 [Nitrospinota bacterium]
MAMNPIPPQTPSLPSLAKPGPSLPGREAAARSAAEASRGAAPARMARPAENIEVQLARIFARRAMLAQQKQMEGAPALSAPTRQTRGVHLDIQA